MDYRLLFATVLLFAFADAIPLNSTSCPEHYQRFSTRHSFCLAKNPRCEIIRSGLTQQERDIAVATHNKLRSIIANRQKGNDGLPGASDMLLMEWDEELAQIGQHYSDQCNYNHDGHDERRSQMFSIGVGQNIYEGKTSNQYEKPDWDKAVRSWYSEIQFFERDMICKWNTLTSRGVHGHFTQVAWAKSFRVGCAYTMYRAGSIYKQQLLCNYGFSGNVQGECVYETGSACSKCPKNTRCTDYDSEYPGLCERIGTNLPPIFPNKLNVPLRYNCDFSDGCEVGLQGKGSWTIINAIGGYYLEGLLQPGETGTVVFSKTFSAGPGAGSMCAVLRYRRGPNLSKDADYSHSLKAYFNDLVYELNNLMPKTFRHLFTPMSLGLPVRSSTKVKLTFSVPSYAPTSQFFAVSSLIAYDGDCK